MSTIHVNWIGGPDFLYDGKRKGSILRGLRTLSAHHVGQREKEGYASRRIASAIVLDLRIVKRRVYWI